MCRPNKRLRITSAIRVRRRPMYRTRLVCELTLDRLLKTFGHEHCFATCSFTVWRAEQIRLDPLAGCVTDGGDRQKTMVKNTRKRWRGTPGNDVN